MLHRQSRDFVRYFARAYPARTAVMVALLVLSGVAEGVGIVSLLPMLEVVLNGDAGAEPSALSALVHSLLGWIGLPPTLPVLLCLIVAGMGLKGLFLWLAMREVGFTVSHVTTDLRLRLLRALMHARWSYFTGQPAGAFATAISSEAHRASGAYRQAGTALAAVIRVLIYATLVVLVSWRVALAAMVAGAVFVFLLNGFVDMARGAGGRQTAVMRSLIARLTDTLQGIKPIKAMGREDQLWPLLEGEAMELNRAQQRQVIAYESLRSFQEPILVLLIAIGLYAVLAVGEQPFSVVLVLVFLFHRVMGSVHQIQNEYQGMATGESAFWSIRALTEEAEGACERSLGTRRPPPVRQGIEMRDVRFSYGERDILKGVSLTIPAGRFVAISGPSGAGKTTIADLVVGLQTPDSGEILVDGSPLGELDLSAWRRRIGYVPQEMLLFHDTIYRNVALGEPGITPADVEAALRAAGAWEFVATLEEGMDRVIGERGTRLSGGQRQRIAIARALVTQPSVLILDEVTTALDPDTERAICETLRRLHGRVTIVSISHQPAMRAAADTVYHLEGGTIVRVEATSPPSGRAAAGAPALL